MRTAYRFLAAVALATATLTSSLLAAPQAYIGRLTIDDLNENLQFAGALATGDVFEFEFTVDYDGLVTGNGFDTNEYDILGTPTLRRVGGSGTWDPQGGSFGDIYIRAREISFIGITEQDLWLQNGSFPTIDGYNLHEIWFGLDYLFEYVPAGSTLSQLLDGARLEDLDDRFSMNWLRETTPTLTEIASLGGTIQFIAVPEPGTAGLVGLALAAAIVHRRRRCEEPAASAR